MSPEIAVALLALLVIVAAAVLIRARRRAWARWTAGMILAVLILPVACVHRIPPFAPGVAVPPAPAPADSFRVYVTDWDYHTSIIIEQPPGWQLGPPGKEDAPYVEYAWGDKRFYMEANYWPHAVFATLFLPTASVTYVDGRALPPRDTEEHPTFMRAIGGQQMRALVHALETSIERTESGARRPPFPVVDRFSGRFYPGVGDYTWWYNCNRWTVERLAVVGLATDSRWVIFSGQVDEYLIGFRRTATIGLDEDR